MEKGGWRLRGQGGVDDLLRVIGDYWQTSGERDEDGRQSGADTSQGTSASCFGKYRRTYTARSTRRELRCACTEQSRHRS